MKFDQYDIWFHERRQRWVLELFCDGLPVDNNFCSSREEAERLLANLQEKEFMTYEDQLGGLAALLARRSDELRAEIKAVDGRYDAMDAAISRHMTDIFNIVNEAQDNVRSFESRLRILERLVHLNLVEGANRDPRDSSHGGPATFQDSCQGPNANPGGYGPGYSLISGSAGSSVLEHRSEEEKGEGTQGEEREGGEGQA